MAPAGAISVRDSPARKQRKPPAPLEVFQAGPRAGEWRASHLASSCTNAFEPPGCFGDRRLHVSVGTMGHVRWEWGLDTGTVTLGRQSGPSTDLKEVHSVGGTQRRDSTQLEDQKGRSKIGSAAGWALRVLTNRHVVNGILCGGNSKDGEA